jgi:hypothetical protein
MLTEAMIEVKARATCNPPSLFGTSLLPGTYWAPTTTVNVEIDDAWEQADRDALASGAQKWNSAGALDCSFVTFTNFAPRHFTDYVSDPPADTFWFQRAQPGSNFNGGVFHNKGGIPLRLISARDKINPQSSIM